MTRAIDAFFLPTARRQPSQRLCIHLAPRAPLRGMLVYVHPWGDEMNKARRMARLQAHALADAGFAVLQIDLLGCGDSSGDFADATWPDWIDDVHEAATWLRARYDAPLWLWGLRAGCLIATQAAARLDGPCHFLFWQPVSSGQVHLQQFLRLKLAGDLMGAGGKGVMDGLKRDIAEGRTVEVAGYALSAALADGLAQARLVAPPAPTRVLWFEVSPRDDALFAPASTTTMQAWRDAGAEVRERLVRGPAFWQTTEIEDAPALIDATRQALCEASGP